MHVGKWEMKILTPKTRQGGEKLQNAQEVSGSKTTSMSHQEVDLRCSALTTKMLEHLKFLGKNYGELGLEQFILQMPS